MLYVVLTLFSVLFMGKSFSEEVAVKETQWDLRLIAYVLDDEADRDDLSAKVDMWRGELMERDVLLVCLGERQLDGYPSLDLSEEEKLLWRNVWQLGPDESYFVLIGKDGGAKALQKGDLNLRRFVLLIDSMPLRRAEMREEVAHAAR